jgi:oligogalacturonide lyase
MFNIKRFVIAIIVAFFILPFNANSQIGTRFPSEGKVVKDPLTGTMLTFLTSKPHGDSKIYPTHPQMDFRRAVAHIPL